MWTAQLYILLCWTSFLPTLCYCSMAWGYIGGGRTYNLPVWKPDSNHPWPGSRSEASTWQDKNGDLWMFGGFGFNSEKHLEYLNDLWRFNVHANRWYVMKTSNKSEPSGRASSSSCGVPGIMMVTYGGAAGHNSVYGDTWIYIIPNNTWLTLNTKSAPASRSEAATWCTRMHMFVFGGRNNKTVLADMWMFSLKDLTWTKLFSSLNSSVLAELTQPQGRTGAFAWAFENENRNSLYMFGGEIPNKDPSDSVYSNEMWEYSLTAKNWSLLSGGDKPADSPRYNTVFGRKSVVALSNPDKGNLFLFGGKVLLQYDHNTAFIGDAWLYNTELSQWYWASGKATSEEERKVGPQMVAGSCYTPGARAGAMGWFYENKFYIFGGKAHNEDQLKYANDFWYMTYPSGPISSWIPILVIILGLILIGILTVVGLYSRGVNSLTRGTSSYSLVANSDMFDS